MDIFDCFEPDGTLKAEEQIDETEEEKEEIKVCKDCFYYRDWKGRQFCFLKELMTNQEYLVRPNIIACNSYKSRKEIEGND